MKVFKGIDNRKQRQNFHQWKRKSYSLFSILGRSIRIGVLAVIYVLSLAPLKAQIDTVEILRQQDYQLDEVEVRAERTPLALSEVARQLNVITRKDIEAAGYSSIDQILNHFGEIDQRSRGPLGIQSDISLNGGTYEQVMVLLNGINITDPQTGHFHMDIPVPVSAIERIEVISGSASRILGPNAYGGAINIVTRKEEGPALKINSLLGQNKFRNADVYAGSKWGGLRMGASSMYSSTSGYRENTDSKNGSVYLSGSYEKARQSLSWQAGANKKAFGANAFYSPLYPDQYEETAALTSSISWEKEGRLNWRQDIYARYHQDEFHLFRYESPSWYSGPNNHLSRILGSQHNFWLDSKAGRTSFGADWRMEKLWSNVLGDTLVTEDFRMANKLDTLDFGGFRNHMSAFAEHRFSHKNFSFSGGLLAHFLYGKTAGSYLYPGVDISYRLFPDLKIYSSINKSLRLPSFTEMYYKSPTHIGNTELLPETAWEYMFGIRLAKSRFTFNTSLNARWSENSIDWVRGSPNDKWITRNETDIFSMSMDFSLVINKIEIGNLPDGIRMKFGYHYTFQEKGEMDMDSKYLMDYLKHKASWQSGIRFLRNGMLILDIHLQDRAGDYTDWDEDGKAYQRAYNPFILTDLRLNWRLNKTSFNISLNNLFNTQYADLGHIWQPGRWVMAGINYEL